MSPDNGGCLLSFCSQVVYHQAQENASEWSWSMAGLFNARHNGMRSSSIAFWRKSSALKYYCKHTRSILSTCRKTRLFIYVDFRTFKIFNDFMITIYNVFFRLKSNILKFTTRSYSYNVLVIFAVYPLFGPKQQNENYNL